MNPIHFMLIPGSEINGMMYLSAITFVTIHYLVVQIIPQNLSENDWDVYVFMRFYAISSNPFFLSMVSPLPDERLTAGWLISNILAISTVLIPNLRCAHQPKSDLA
ncbi:MAG: hypothetical protein WA151_16440 [Desulfatirhabdiaceae bacterium]